MPFQVDHQTGPTLPPIDTGPVREFGHDAWQAKRIWWAGLNGDPIDVTDYRSGWFARQGRRGFDGPADPEFLLTQKAQGGATIDAVRYGPQILTSPLTLKASDPTGLKALRRRFGASIQDTPDGWWRSQMPLGSLTVIQGDGETRWIPARFYAGAQGTESVDKQSWTAPGLQFIAPHPWWQGVTHTFTLSYVAVQPFFPLYPLYLAPVTVDGDNPVVIEGDAPQTHPVITVTGPGSATAKNSTLGQSWKTVRPLVAGERLVVDHRPVSLAGEKSETAWLYTGADDTVGVNAFRLLARFPDFWPLAAGNNRLSVSMVGAGAASSLVVQWAEQWQGAH